MRLGVKYTKHMELTESLQNKEHIVSQHRSFKSASKILVKRNVLKRYERVDLLRSRGQWKEGDRGQGLPKTKPE